MRPIEPHGTNQSVLQHVLRFTWLNRQNDDRKQSDLVADLRPPSQGEGPDAAADADNDKDAGDLVLYDEIDEENPAGDKEIDGDEEHGVRQPVKLVLSRRAALLLSRRRTAASPSTMALVFIFLAASTVSAYSYLFGWSWTFSPGALQEVNAL